MQQLMQLYHDIPSETWVAILGAGGVSIVTQWLKKLMALENGKVVHTLFVAIAFAASALQYVLGAHNVPPTILGMHTAILIGIATPFYNYVVKPLDEFMGQVKDFQVQQTKSAAPAVPVVEQPVTAAKPTSVNF